jgi:hypothetical protein
MSDLGDKIESAASGPKTVKADGVEVTSHDLDKLIQADKHLAGKEAVAKPNRGLRFNKLVPPGSV